MLDQTDLHIKMKNYRREKRCTLEEVAKQLRIGASYLSRIERGEVPLPPSKVLLFVNYFGITVEELAAFVGVTDKVRKADPNTQLRTALQQCQEQIGRMQSNIENYLNHNLLVLEREEVEKGGLEGAPDRALERMFQRPALGILLNRENTSKDYFLINLYHDYCYAQQNEGFSKEKYIKQGEQGS